MLVIKKGKTMIILKDPTRIVLQGRSVVGQS